MKKKILLIGLFVFFSTYSFALNYGEIQGIIHRLVNDTDRVNPHFSDVTISTFINLTHQKICAYTWLLEGVTYYTIIDGQQEYKWYNDMYAIKRITMNDVVLPEISIAKLDKDKNWQTYKSSQTPTYYYVNHTTYSVIGFDVVPSTSSYNQLKVQYIKIPDDMVANSDIPFGGIRRVYQYHYLICFYTAALLLFQDNRSADGLIYYNIYEKGLDILQKTWWNPNYMPSSGISK